jgi:hypothetical protein
MSPLRRHTPRSRDDALQRRHSMAVTATIGGLTAVGVITGALAVNAAQSNAATSSSGGVSSDGGATQPGGGVAQDPAASQGGGTLNPPVNAPSFGGRGGGASAVTGGSGHH